MKKLTTLLFALAMLLVAVAALATPSQIGGSLSGPSNSSYTLIEPPLGEVSGAITTFENVQSGYVILRETLGPSGNTTWSDVMIITAAGHAPTNTAGDAATKVVIVSEGTEGAGITDADLAAIQTQGLPLITVAGIGTSLTAGFAVKRWETAGNKYAPGTAWKPTNPKGIRYLLNSQPEASVPGVSPAILAFLFGLLAITGVLVLRRKQNSGSTLA